MIHAPVKRTPVVNRTPVKRIPILLNSVRCESCVLHRQCSIRGVIPDCSGKPFYYVDITSKTLNKDLTSVLKQDIMPYILVEYKSQEYSSNLIELSKKLSVKNLPMYLVTSEPVPEEVLTVMSTNPFNIIQATLNCDTRDSVKSSNLREMFFVARNCGIHTILRIEPIMPGVTKSYEVIDLINSMKNCINHIMLKFVSINRLQDKLQYLSYKDWLMSGEYFEYKDGVYSCTNEFISEFMGNLLVAIGKKTIAICGESNECRGLPMRLSKKVDGLYEIMSVEDTNKTLMEGYYENH